MTASVKFWGVRGSIACPSPPHLGYGGNTSCVEVVFPDEDKLIFDCGTGIHNLGDACLREEAKHVNILLSHTLWDHINGFPFFAPVFRKDRSMDIHCGHLLDKGGIERILADHLDQPLFPVPLELMGATKNFHDFEGGGSDFVLGKGINVKTAKLNHPAGATGCRVEKGGVSICYVTDTEHGPDKPDDSILGLIEGADLVIYDSTYTDAEFPDFVG